MDKVEYYELIKEYPRSKPIGTRWLLRHFGYLEEYYCGTPYEGYPIYYEPENFFEDSEYFKKVTIG